MTNLINVLSSLALTKTDKLLRRWLSIELSGI